MSNNFKLVFASMFFLVVSILTLCAFLTPIEVVELEAIPLGKNMAVFYYQDKSDIEYHYSLYYPGNYEKVYRVSYWYGSEYISVPDIEQRYGLLDLQDALIDGSGYHVQMKDAYDLYTSKDNYKHSVKLELLTFFTPLF
jgi:hypothetical protein